ncbi:MAG: PadR family transcriptional regulator [Coriobacteriia bacterium]|nr:PadR family transcriptional regulator [Coriobacteriia bacterium]
MPVKGRRRRTRPELDCILLCLIRMHKDASGYQLRAFIEESTAYLYRAHLSQIYPALKRLHDDGLVTCYVQERTGKPDLKLYQITEEGIAVAEEWLTSAPEFDSTRESASRQLMRLVLMGHLEPEQIIAYVDDCIEVLSEAAAQHRENNLLSEVSFLADLDSDTRNRYELIWKHESGLIQEKYDLQLEHLRQLRAELEA